jgi:hypothetical protein
MAGRMRHYRVGGVQMPTPQPYAIGIVRHMLFARVCISGTAKTKRYICPFIHTPWYDLSYRRIPLRRIVFYLLSRNKKPRIQKGLPFSSVKSCIYGRLHV